MIYPENQTKGIWDIFMTGILFISCVLTPIDIAFNNEGLDSFEDVTPSKIFKLIIDVLFLIDIIFCFFTAT